MVLSRSILSLPLVSLLLSCTLFVVPSYADIVRGVGAAGGGTGTGTVADAEEFLALAIDGYRRGNGERSRFHLRLVADISPQWSRDQSDYWRLAALHAIQDQRWPQAVEAIERSTALAADPRLSLLAAQIELDSPFPFRALPHLEAALAWYRDELSDAATPAADVAAEAPRCEVVSLESLFDHAELSRPLWQRMVSDAEWRSAVRITLALRHYRRWQREEIAGGDGAVITTPHLLSCSRQYLDGALSDRAYMQLLRLRLYSSPDAVSHRRYADELLRRGAYHEPLHLLRRALALQPPTLELFLGAGAESRDGDRQLGQTIAVFRALARAYDRVELAAAAQSSRELARLLEESLARRQLQRDAEDGAQLARERQALLDEARRIGSFREGILLQIEAEPESRRLRERLAERDYDASRSELLFAFYDYYPRTGVAALPDLFTLD